ncbi:A/G-specific adenine glycosylase [bacterium]|nr:A/G-specific adenine glycosylase [bacterium]MCP5462057.1 A/G-specific adenine glycosylase [bacterium]
MQNISWKLLPEYPHKFEKFTRLRDNKNDAELITDFQRNIYEFYKTHKRPMPWRDIDDPYRVLVSEVMLQQTQVERIIKMYPPFIDAFPAIDVLAKAPFDKVFALWQGLGYNRRALFLHRCSKIIVERFDSVIPNKPDSLAELPGLGWATACSICTFAYNMPLAFIETNIRSVYLSFFFPDEKNVPDKHILPLVEKTLDYDNPRQWYYALMDYGVMLKKMLKNPSRRSAHHTKQSPFDGSFRQVRGAVMKQLTERGSLSKTDLCSSLAFSNDAILAAVMCLESEGFIIVNNDCITLKSDELAQ